ncbi:MAG: protease complex subunit PrcB family protein [Lachnospiraceae bacterium]|nr:protease complex subunit PrcB family protein [Lachnospiraceae bacterium]
MRKRHWLLLMVYALFIVSCLTSCGKSEDKIKKEIDFTVCDKTRMPEELVEIIEEKKAKVFKLSYISSDYMYIAIGYGEKIRQNLNVVVEDLYMTDNAIYVETNLITKEQTEDGMDAGGESMYPYIVLKCENYDLPVVFDID